METGQHDDQSGSFDANVDPEQDRQPGPDSPAQPVADDVPVRDPGDSGRVSVANADDLSTARPSDSIQADHEPTRPEQVPPDSSSSGQAASQIPAPPIKVDNRSRRSDRDALEGHFCDVVSGEHQGRFGSFDRVSQFNAETGYPERILIVTRDANNELLEVPYEDVRPSERSGGR